ncbi:MAG: sulfatase-like hydrolase/transferase [Candidatus Pacebacteria bacterium]|nr:sulfatase-like hydrolase/transferase [Candidatus Paceibacterota bacterium]
MKWKLLVILILTIIGITAASFYFFSQKECKDCHLIVFDADILRADAIDCINSPEVTPNLCELKDEFIIFNNHYSHNDLTKPSMASFLTSTYPSSHGIWNEFFYLDKKQPNILDILKKNDYYTIITGYEGSNSQVFHDIYDEKINIDTTDIKIVDLIREQQTFLFLYNANLHYPYLSSNESAVISHPKKPEGFPNNVPEFDDRAKDIILEKYPYVFEKPALKKYIEDHNGSTKGIYGYLSYLCWDADIKIRLINIDACWVITEDTFERYIDKNNPDHIEFIKYLYLERLKETDKEIGEIIDNLKNNNLWNKTVFAIRSDHGEEFMEHGTLNHWNNLYEELLKVPFWIHIPRHKGREVNYLTQTIDETTTILKAVGIEPHTLMQGRNLLDKKLDNKEFNYAIYQKIFNLTFAFKEGDYKLISISDTDSEDIDFELYNLKEDPLEQINIVEDNLEIKEEMLNQYYNTINDLPKYSPYNEILKKLTKEQEKNLYENGYF